MVEFIFKKIVLQLVITHKWARNASELAEIASKIESSSIFTHLHSKFIEGRFQHPELANDFSSWAKLNLDDAPLSERFANIDIWHAKSIEELREKIVSTCKDNLGHKVHEGEEFVFITAVPMIFNAEKRAYDLNSFINAIRKVDESSIFYHFLVSRFLNNKEDNEFSIYLDAIGERKISENLRDFDPYDSIDLSSVREEIIKVLEGSSYP